MLLAVRPEEVRLRRDAPDGAVNVFSGRVRSVTFLGSVRRCTVEADGIRWVVDVRPEESVGPGQEIYVEVPPDRVRVVQEM